MNGVRHPFTGALYERADDGTLLVTSGAQSGRFRADGSWIEGDLRECDPQLCGWVVGPKVAHHRLTETVPPPHGHDGRAHESALDISRG